MVQWGCNTKTFTAEGLTARRRLIWHTLCQAVGTAILGRCIAICHAKNDLSEDRCRKCGVPLLK